MMAEPSARRTANFTGISGAWLRWAGLSAWMAIGACSLLLALSSLGQLSWLGAILAPLQAHVDSDKALYSPLGYFCLLSVVYLLERHVPAREQAVLTAGFMQDALWYAGSVVFSVAFLGLYVLLLERFYQQHLPFLTIDSISEWSAWSRFLLGVIAADFLRWLSHLIRHKVPLFWKFHAVHHSQTQLNLFTDARVHPVDTMVSATLRFIPFLMLGNDLPTILAWAIFETLYPKLYHANVRLNFGPLRYILVTPQSHRVHHAFEPRFRDTNFGFIFSLWDRLFGTHYLDDFTYPDTGIADPEYPHEQGADLASLAATFAKQLIYPFRLLFRAR